MGAGPVKVATQQDSPVEAKQDEGKTHMGDGGTKQTLLTGMRAAGHSDPQKCPLHSEGYHPSHPPLKHLWG